MDSEFCGIWQNFAYKLFIVETLCSRPCLPHRKISNHYTSVLPRDSPFQAFLADVPNRYCLVYFVDYGLLALGSTNFPTKHKLLIVCRVEMWCGQQTHFGSTKRVRGIQEMEPTNVMHATDSSLKEKIGSQFPLRVKLQGSCVCNVWEQLWLIQMMRSRYTMK